MRAVWAILGFCCWMLMVFNIAQADWLLAGVSFAVAMWCYFLINKGI